MEFFNGKKAVKLRCHHNKYLVASDDEKSVRQSRNGSTRKARWIVELVDFNPQVIRLKSVHGGYLTASTTPFLLGFTGNKVLQTRPDHPRVLSTEWAPVRYGFKVRLVSAFGGTCLRADRGMPPWKDSVTHDGGFAKPSWILWEVEIPAIEEFKDTLSLSDGLFGSEIGSPVSIHMNNSPMPTKGNNAGYAANALNWLRSPNNIKAPLENKIQSGIELFQNTQAVRLLSNQNKYLFAKEDEKSVTQDSNGFSNNARWTVEFSSESDNIIRLKSCYGKYLTASNTSFLLGMSGRKVVQTAGHLDSSMDWEPIRDGHKVKLKTRYGSFLLANNGIPPWRNSVMHDVSNGKATQDWVLWNIDAVEIVSLQLPRPESNVEFGSSSESNHWHKSHSLTNDSMGSSASNERLIYYSIADEYGNLVEGSEGLSLMFTGNGVHELTKRLEKQTGLEDIIVCSRNPLNKLYPLRLELPPKNVDIHIVVVQSSSRAGRGSVRT